MKSFGPPSKRLDLGVPKFGGLKKGIDAAMIAKGKASSGTLLHLPWQYSSQLIWKNSIACAYPTGSGEINRTAH